MSSLGADVVVGAAESSVIASAGASVGVAATELLWAHGSELESSAGTGAGVEVAVGATSEVSLVTLSKVDSTDMSLKGDKVVVLGDKSSERDSTAAGASVLAG